MANSTCAAELRAKAELLKAQAEKLIQAAELVEQAESGNVGASNGKVGRFSREGYQRLRQFNAEKWVECPKSPPCQTRDKATGRMRVKKHRLGHLHLKGATVVKLQTTDS